MFNKVTDLSGLEEIIAYFLQRADNFDPTKSKYAKEFLPEGLSDEQAHCLARKLVADPYKFLKNKYTAQQIADIFNKCVKIAKPGQNSCSKDSSESEEQTIDWIAFTGNYSYTWLTYLVIKKSNKTLVIGEFKKTIDRVPRINEFTGKMEIENISGERFSFTSRFLAILNKYIDEDGIEALYPLSAFVRKPQSIYHRGINHRVRALDDKRAELAMSIHNDEERIKNGNFDRVLQYEVKDTNLQMLKDSGMYGDLSTTDPKLKNIFSETVKTSLDKDDISAVNLNPKTYKTYTSPIESHTSMFWLRETVKHSNIAVVDVLNYVKVANGKVSATDKERALKQMLK